MTPERVAEARHLYEARSKTVTEIANLFGVSRPTVYRVLGDTSGQAL
ncbi:helix-turn-helix domain-containing protein [Frondihabitans sp. Leaf304]